MLENEIINNKKRFDVKAEVEAEAALAEAAEAAEAEAEAEAKEKENAKAAEETKRRVRFKIEKLISSIEDKHKLRNEKTTRNS